MRTFFLSPDQWREPYVLHGQEAKHLIRVLRLPVGAELRLLDGRGREGIFRVFGMDKRSVFLQAVHIRTHARPQSRCTLALGYMRDIRRSWLLEKAVELEAGALWFWQAERSQSRLPEAGKESWQAQMEAGAKQCNNFWLPELRIVPGGAHQLAEAGSGFSRAYMLREGDAESRILGMHDLAGEQDALFVLGPEGGFSDQEAALLRAGGIEPVSLGRRVLRWETAALLCLGLCWWARQPGVAESRPFPLPLA